MEPDDEQTRLGNGGNDHCVVVLREINNGVINKVFRCTLCHVVLDSLEKKKAHVGGSRHVAEVKAMQRRKNAIRKLIANPKPKPKPAAQKPAESIRAPVPKPPPAKQKSVESIRAPVPKPPPAKQKSVERLSARIESVGDAVVGIEFIDEFLPFSVDDMEPFYKCRICQSEGEGKAMLNHLIGHDHRLNFFFAKAGKLYTEAECARMAEFYCEKDTRFRVKTYVGDDTYPWPKGPKERSASAGGPRDVSEKYKSSLAERLLVEDTYSRSKEKRPSSTITGQSDSSRNTNERSMRVGSKTHSNDKTRTRPREKKPSATGQSDGARSWKAYLANKHHIDNGPDGPA
jgi:hypothetical protein